MTQFDPAVHKWPHLVHADQLTPIVVTYLHDESDKMLRLLTRRDDFKMKAEETSDCFAETPHSLKTLRALASCVVLLHFNEASTRTATSFSVAAARLDAQSYLIQDVGPAEDSPTSRRKGETLDMALQMYRQYHADALVVRSPDVGDPYLAAQLFEDYNSSQWSNGLKRWGVVINAGNGDDQHPTQALLDLYAIKKVAGRLSDLSILFAGDIGRARAVNSLLIALANCGHNITLKMAVPIIDGYRLTPPDITLSRLQAAGVNFELVDVPDRDTFLDLAATVDFGYWTRLQAERYGSELPTGFSERNAEIVRLDEQLMQHANQLHAFHPLPYHHEVEPNMQRHPRAMFNRQAGWGVPVRMALLLNCILYPRRLQKLAGQA